ncbi:MAG: MraZ protein [Actinomycetota bacterium]
MRDPVQTYSGRFDRQLDDKGRVALPARLRSALGEEVCLTRGQDRCVIVVPAAVFDAQALRMRQRVDAGELHENDLRGFTHPASFGTVDRQGRVVIEEHLRTYALLTLGSTVKVTGSVDRLEIWNLERYEQIDELNTRARGGDSV